MNYLPTCTSRLVVQHLYQVSFKSMRGCRRSWEDKLWWDGRTEWRTNQTLNTPCHFMAGHKMPVQIMKYAVIFHILCQSEGFYASQNRLTCYFQHHCRYWHFLVTCMCRSHVLYMIIWLSHKNEIHYKADLTHRVFVSVPVVEHRNDFLIKNLCLLCVFIEVSGLMYLGHSFWPVCFSVYVVNFSPGNSI